MKTIGIIAEFNPFHRGHEYLIDKCKKDLNADFCVVVMSGDFVQRGAPAIVDKFTRTRMALNGGADLIFELPIYYSLGSAEFFALGAVSLLNSLGVVDYLCFGSEIPDLGALDAIADILVKEPDDFKKALNENLKNGDSYPAARSKALQMQLPFISDDILKSPNSILAIEYLKALKLTGSKIKPYTIQRKGEGYHSEEATKFSSAQGIRKLLLANTTSHPDDTDNLIKELIPASSVSEFDSYLGKFVDINDFSDLLHYKLLLEKGSDFTRYLDITDDLSNRINANIEIYKDFNSFCELLKSKNLTFTRISRCMMHILLNITKENMDIYKADNFTSYLRILGMKKECISLLSSIKENGQLPIINRLKDTEKILSPIQMKLFEETLSASLIYNSKASNNIVSEYKLKQIII
jgi:predicted nucleotidyltransferase